MSEISIPVLVTPDHTVSDILETTSLVIEKDIPMPPAHQRNKGLNQKFIEMFEKMALNDSFLVPIEDAEQGERIGPTDPFDPYFNFLNKMRSRISTAAGEYRSRGIFQRKFKISTRKVPTGLRVWRVR